MAMRLLQELRVISRLLALVLLLQNRYQALATSTMQVLCNALATGLQRIVDLGRNSIHELRER